MANIRDVATRAGVSASTVSRVLSGTAQVSDKKKESVYKAINDLEYDINHVAKKLENASAKIGIIIPKDAAIDLAGHPAFSSAISSFEKELKRQNCASELILLNDNPFESLKIINKTHYAAYFILGTNEEQEDFLLPHLRENHYPYIILNRWLNDSSINYVNVDDEKAAQLGTEYLIGLGHRDIVFIGGNKNFRNSKLRIKGYECAMRKAHLRSNPQYILQGEYSEGYGYQVGDKIVAMKKRPTAALVSSDMIAVGLQRRLHELGLRLPEDLSMIGWGDFTIASYITPALTTIRMPTSEMGTQAAIALNNMIQYPDVIGTHILMNAPLIIRNSCCQFLKNPTTTQMENQGSSS